MNGISLTKMLFGACLVGSVLNGNQSFSQDSLSCLAIVGKCVQGENDVREYKVVLYDGNEKINSKEVIKERDFAFVLKKNKSYSIQITKSGYLNRLISVDTHLPANVSISPVFRFVFEIEMKKQLKKSASDDDALDFPLVLISYNSELDRFDYNRKYTAKIKEDIRSIGR